jgi:hypothetical protein
LHEILLFLSLNCVWIVAVTIAANETTDGTHDTATA